MQEFSASDSAYMAQALRLARRGAYTAHPNPLVGCVLVRGGEAIGQGWHATTGDAHAEVNALDAAGDAKGAIAALERALALEPDNELYRANLETLRGESVASEGGEQ